MPPPDNGNEYLPFVDMIALEKINPVTYRSKALPFSPGGGGRSYGGHVYAQAVWAAAQTVQPGFVVHVSGVCVLCILNELFGQRVSSDFQKLSTRLKSLQSAQRYMTYANTNNRT